ncbi:MAG: hypothetical protein ABW007_06955 [Chitinophagaceae bacterium]
MNAKRITRILSITGAVPVTMVAGWVSYWHTVHVVASHGQDAITAHIMPLSVEGMMIVSAVALVSNPKQHLPKIAFLAGVLAVLGANIASVPSPDPISMIVATWPALALVITSKMLLALFIKPAPARRTARTVTKKATTTPTPRTRKAPTTTK